MKTEADSTAFPCERHDGFPGLTKREYFAAMAMQAIITKSPFMAEPQTFDVYQKTAIGALDYADALIAALNEVKP